MIGEVFRSDFLSSDDLQFLKNIHFKLILHTHFLPSLSLHILQQQEQ